MTDPEDDDPRPHCPRCRMRMITTATPPAPRRLECLRCGYTEIASAWISSPRPDLRAG
jgi:predicted nucleic-acid-binding Zn-ribbon protein